jgi:hypothetical protein
MDDWAAKRIAELEAAAPKKRKKKVEREFVQISRKQLAILRRGRAKAAAWNVFAELVWLSWKAGGKSIKFTNHSLAEMNISHGSRTRAIRELVKLGLVRIDRSTPRKSPILTVLQI